jgi:hypothetical protein
VADVAQGALGRVDRLALLIDVLDARRADEGPLDRIRSVLQVHPVPGEAVEGLGLQEGDDLDLAVGLELGLEVAAGGPGALVGAPSGSDAPLALYASSCTAPAAGGVFFLVFLDAAASPGSGALIRFFVLLDAASAASRSILDVLVLFIVLRRLAASTRTLFVVVIGGTAASARLRLLQLLIVVHGAAASGGSGHQLSSAG